MIPRTRMPRHTPQWRRTLADGVSSIDELLQLLGLDIALAQCARAATANFPLRVPRGFVARMTKGNIHDPLLRQVLPLDAESRLCEGYTCDPLREQSAMPVPGVLHKYHGRALLMATGACAIHCRYCFRRHFPYSEANAAARDWDDATRYLGARPDIHEVILSGGDPLILDDDRLQRLAELLDGIPHLRRLRIHTRLPVVLPERIDGRLLEWVGNRRIGIVVVIHANHPNEIDHTVITPLHRLRDAGATLLNQAVLLRGVNDSASTLIGLSEALFAAGVLPYYLHQLDRVSGAAHFEVDDDTARSLICAIHARLPGYLVPRLVRESPGMPGKTALGNGNPDTG
jgi:EF-P beta-lysylation protein EpmB